MWFFNQPRVKYMTKITLIDGQEFVGEDGEELFIGTIWVRINLDDAWILYPLHRVRDIRTWKEVS